jgi:hypothetical protein
MNLPRLTLRDLLTVTDALMSIDASERTPSRLRDALAPATLPGQPCWADEEYQLFGMPGSEWVE